MVVIGIVVPHHLSGYKVLVIPVQLRHSNSNLTFAYFLRRSLTFEADFAVASAFI